MDVQVPMWYKLRDFGCLPSSGIIGSCSTILLVFWETSRRVSIAGPALHIPKSSDSGLLSPISSPGHCSWFPNESSSDWGRRFLCALPDGHWCGTLLKCLLAICVCTFENCPVYWPIHGLQNLVVSDVSLPTSSDLRWAIAASFQPPFSR